MGIRKIKLLYREEHTTWWRLLMRNKLILNLSVCLAFVAGIQQSSAHSWYTGKRDPVTGTSCCGGYDCGPVEKVQVRAVSGGWLILLTGEVVAYSRTQISEDDQFHRCVYLNGQRKGQTRCLFAPPMGF